MKTRFSEILIAIHTKLAYNRFRYKPWVNQEQHDTLFLSFESNLWVSRSLLSTLIHALPLLVRHTFLIDENEVEKGEWRRKLIHKYSIYTFYNSKNHFNIYFLFIPFLGGYFFHVKHLDAVKCVRLVIFSGTAQQYPGFPTWYKQICYIYENFLQYSSNLQMIQHISCFECSYYSDFSTNLRGNA